MPQSLVDAPMLGCVPCVHCSNQSGPLESNNYSRLGNVLVESSYIHQQGRTIVHLKF